MAINGINTAMSALQANQLRVDVSANNVANVNTPGFQPAQVTGSDLGYINDIGQGTRATAAPTYSPARMAMNSAGTATSGVTGAAQQPPLQPPGAGMAAAPGAAEAMSAPSGTDPVIEMTNQMAARNAYSAATGYGRASDEMNQTLVNLVR